MSRRTMDWLVLLGCVSLWAGLALAEVGSFSNCTEYFCRGAEPSGFHTPRTAEICQRYKNQYRFATLYDKANQIPRWSVYILRPSNCPGQPRMLSKWFVEPQLVDQYQPPEMMTEAMSKLTPNQLRSNQAINEDYEDTSYDRGHLNPNSFQNDENHRATFTLTNAAPMNPCFNRIHWSKVERTLKTQLTGNCSNLGGTPYLVTGAVSSNNVKIPIQDEDKEWDRDRPYNCVSVPSHHWTAVCCNHQDKTHKFSFAFLGENKEESKLSNLSVDQLNEVLPRLYNAPGQIKIFKDDCGSKSQKGQEVLSAIKSVLYNTFQILLSDSYSQLLPPVKMSKLDRETTQVMRSTNLNQNIQLTSIGFLMSFLSLADWHGQFEEMYKQDNLTCVLAPASAGVAKASGTWDRVCTLQEQKHLPDSGVTAKGWRCVRQACGYHGYDYRWCNTSHSGDWDYCCTEKCTMNQESN